jgi:hypothetical protein
LPATIQGLARTNADPAFTHAVLLHIMALFALEADADAALQEFCIIVRAPGI